MNTTTPTQNTTTIAHPSWCDPEWCAFDLQDNVCHQSAPFRWAGRSVLFMQTHGDPEPELFVIPRGGTV